MCIYIGILHSTKVEATSLILQEMLQSPLSMTFEKDGAFWCLLTDALFWSSSLLTLWGENN